MSKAASPYLHDRLQARRAMPTRTRRSDSGLRTQHLEDDLFISEAKQYEGSSYAASNATSDPDHTQALGAREMEKRMDKLSKLNFDLKMELFHCRERMVKLQESCKTLALSADKANKLGEENAALLDLNDTLVKELEKRDEAVQEAVTIICELEEKLERTEQQPLPRYITPPRAPASSIPSETLLSPPTSSQSSNNKSSCSRPQKRFPSFMGEKKPSTRALRSVYLEPVPTLHAVKSYASLISQREEAEDADALNSPQLSVLSESSFPSIYNPLEETALSDKPEEDNALFHHLRQMDTSLTQRRGTSDNSGSDLNSWIRVQTPQPSTFLMEPGYLHQAHVKAPPSQQQPRSVPSGNQLQGKRPSPNDLDFGGGSLPPTPESASTFVLQESHSDFADANDRHAKPAAKVLESFANAAKQTALLHNPENCAVLNSRKIKRTSNPKSVPSDPLWMSTRRSVDLSSSEEELDYNNDYEINPVSIDDDPDEAMYPNGGSIITGTPSRFQVRHSESPATNLIFDGNGINNITARPPARRRNTSSEISFQHLPNVDPRGMERSETSPNVATLGTATATHTDRTIGAFDHQDQPFLTPEKLGRRDCPEGQWSSTKPPSKSQAAAPSSMRASLSQKTHKLLRRMSDGRGVESPASKARPATAHSATKPTRHHAYASSGRPSTGYNSVSHREQNDDSCIHSESLHGVQRPSRDQDLMALQAANQAISRRQSEEVHARGMTLSPGSSRRLFKRAGSIRR